MGLHVDTVTIIIYDMMCVSGTVRRARTLGSGAPREREGPRCRQVVIWAWSTSWQWSGAAAGQPSEACNRLLPGPAGQWTREDDTHQYRCRSAPCLRCTCSRWPVVPSPMVPTTILPPYATRTPFRTRSTRRPPRTLTELSSGELASVWTRPPPPWQLHHCLPTTAEVATATAAAASSRQPAQLVRPDTVGRWRPPRHCQPTPPPPLAARLRTTIATHFRTPANRSRRKHHWPDYPPQVAASCFAPPTRFCEKYTIILIIYFLLWSCLN